MRPGPVVAELAKPTAVGVKIDVVRGGKVLALDVPVTDVVLSATRERVVSQQLTFTAGHEWIPVNDTDPLNNFGQRVHLWSVLEILGVPYRVELGWFQIQSWEENDNSVQVTCLDLMQLLEQNPFTWPSSPPKGATLRGELQRLAGEHLPVILDGGVADNSVERTWQWGTSRTQAITDLCTARGLEYYIEVDGYLHIRKPDNESKGSYRATDLLLSAPRSSKPRRANEFTVVGKGQAPYGTKTEELVKQDYASHSHTGWASSTVKAALTYPVGASGDCLRCTWKVSADAILSHPGLTLTKALPKAGTVTVTMKVRMSASSGWLRYEYMKGDNPVGTSHSVAAFSGWKILTMTLPDGSAAEGIRLFTSESPTEAGTYIDVDSITITKTVKGKTTTILSQDFADHKRPGWKPIEMVPTWSYPEDGRAGDHLRATWDRLSGSSSGRTTLKWSRKVAKNPTEDDTYAGTKTISLYVRSSSSASIAVKAVDEKNVIITSSTVSSKGSWKPLTLTVPEMTVLAGVTVGQAGEFNRGHWIGIDDFRITHTYPTYRDAQWAKTVRATEHPYEAAGYGLVTDRQELNTAQDAQAVLSTAVANMQAALIAKTTRNLEIVMDPRIQVGDCVSVTTGAGEEIKARVVAYSMPLTDKSARMRLDVEELLW